MIFVDRHVFRQPSSLDFGGHRLPLSLAVLGRLASSNFCTCFRLIFPHALAWLLTRFGH